MRRVTIIQRILYQYRVDFYKKLKEQLSKNNIMLKLIIEENKSMDTMDFLDSFIIKKSKHFDILGSELILQPYLRLVADSDLVILELKNSLLLNYILMFKRLLLPNQKLAFWGHALNPQIEKNNLKNKFKSIYRKNVDFWFPYTEGMAALIKKDGFPEEKTEIIYNTIDTTKITEYRKNIDKNEFKYAKEKLRIKNGPVGIFCGRIYKEKRIDFLLNASLKIKDALPDFNMLFIGDGKEAYKVSLASKQHNWIKYVGPAFDREKILYFMMADLFLSPGLVGLSLVESFAMEVPMVTTDYPFHSAEIEYLKNGVNGIMTKNDLDSFVNETVSLLRNPARLANLKSECLAAAKFYTMENMVARLASGITRCLNG